MCMDHDHKSPRIKGQGQRLGRRSKVSAVGLTSILNQGQFLPRHATLARYMPAIVVCVCVCVCVSLSHSVIVSKRLNVGLQNNAT